MSDAASPYDKQRDRFSPGKTRSRNLRADSPKRPQSGQPATGASFSKMDQRGLRNPRQSFLSSKPFVEYQQQTLRPLMSLLFVLPLIMLYEVATLSGETTHIRSGMDQWLHYFLDQLGVGQVVILPMLTAAILLTQHHSSNDDWKISWTTPGWMKVESLILAGCLWMFANFCCLFSSDEKMLEEPTTVVTLASHWDSLLIMIGSGIYEELIFRLILLSLLLAAMQRYLKIPHGHWLAMGLVSWIFAALHYNFINPTGADFETVSFLFRFLASLFFSVIYLYRGFGIAVGTHVIYDILTL